MSMHVNNSVTISHSQYKLYGSLLNVLTKLKLVKLSGFNSEKRFELNTSFNNFEKCLDCTEHVFFTFLVKLQFTIMI